MPLLMLVIPFVLAQGAAVFGTAYLALRLLKASGWCWKVSAMALSYAGWVVCTLAGYFLIGGEGGLMDGLGAMFFLCGTALVSAVAYLFVWLWIPSRRSSAA